MKKKIFNITFYTFLIATLIIPNNIFALYPVAHVNTSDGTENVTPAPTKKYRYDVLKATDSGRYYGLYTYSTKLNTIISVDLVDMNGEDIISADTGIINRTFAAGTWVGANIVETQLANWEYDPDDDEKFTYYEVKKKYSCGYWACTCTKDCCKQLFHYTIYVKYHYSNAQAFGVCKATNPWRQHDIDESGFIYSPEDPLYAPYAVQINKISHATAQTVIDSESGGSLKDLVEKTAWQKAHTEAYNLFQGQTADLEYVDAYKYNYNELNKKGTKTTDNLLLSEYPNKSIKDYLTTAKVNDSKIRLSAGCDNSDKAGTATFYGSGTKCANTKYTSSSAKYKGDYGSTSNSTNGQYVRTYTSSPNEPNHNICINVRTGIVMYNQNGCEGEDLYDVTYTKDDKHYWRYFIPLNTHTNSLENKNSNFLLDFEGGVNGKIPLNKKQCENVIKNYPIKSDYRTMIVDVNGNAFTGAVSSDINKIKYLTVEIDGQSKNGCYNINDIGRYNLLSEEECLKKIEDNQVTRSYLDIITDMNGNILPKTQTAAINSLKEGNACKISMKIEIPVEQKFYGETEENNKKIIKGYSFYYRPIDITNPFPNVNEPSKFGYWYSWSQDKLKNKESPKLEDSFKEVTYRVENINLKDIRTYNKQTENKYTSWRKMEVDGTSKFIEERKNSYIVRENDALKQDYYKLGCGPNNKEWAVCKQ